MTGLIALPGARDVRAPDFFLLQLQDGAGLTIP
jgi:hypothetical protein